ncbi:MAG: hypothetical protein ACRDL7_06730 [Gaiellaceae bacterium]
MDTQLNTQSWLIILLIASIIGNLIGLSFTPFISIFAIAALVALGNPIGKFLLVASLVCVTSYLPILWIPALALGFWWYFLPWIKERMSQ